MRWSENCSNTKSCAIINCAPNTLKILNKSGHFPFLNSFLWFLSKLKTAEMWLYLVFLVGRSPSLVCYISRKIYIAEGSHSYFTNWLNQDCLENLFSIIRWKGEFRDNTDPQQFRAAFRHVIDDKIFVHSISANCTLDIDKTLLDISNVIIMQEKTKETSQSTPAIGPITAAVPVQSVPKQNIVAYMAGYLIRWYHIDNCSTCHDLLKVDNLSGTSPVSQYEPLRFKTYKEIHCLIYPSISFSNFVQTMETLFCSIFGGVMHQNNLLKTLCKTVEKEITELHKCGITQWLHRLHQYVKLYMTVRIHHSLKISNIGIMYGHKRNREMLKLCHE